jgi:nitrite reductase/ring-hydroxylating ferredoxin subunit
VNPANAAQPEPGTPLCALNDIKEPGGKSFRFRAGDAVFAGLVVRFEGQVRGYLDSCPHNGWPLAFDDDRLFSGNHLLCSGHGAMFRPLDGMCVAGPCQDEAMTPWPVRVVDGQVVCV